MSLLSMNPSLDGRIGCLPNIGSSIDTAPTENMPFTHVALANQVFSHDGLLQPDRTAFPNYPAHGKVVYLQKTCSECLASFSTNSNLEQHASSSGHTAFSCICGSRFSRASTLTRHINSMVKPSLPCELCDNKSFPRLDKLGEHLRRYHKLGDKAFDQYKSGNTTPGTASLPNGGILPTQAEGFGQAYPVTPSFDAMSMFNAFPSATNTEPDASSVESSASPGSSTAPDNWWYSQSGNNTAYPS